MVLNGHKIKKYITGRALTEKELRAGPKNICFANSNVGEIHIYVASTQLCWLTSNTVKSLLNLLVFVMNVPSSMEDLSDIQISCALSKLI